MRRLELLIEDSRRETKNEDFSETIGTDDREFVRYANDAQDRLQSLIYQKYQEIFVSEKEINTVAQTQAYDLPFDTFLDNAIVKVQYKDQRNSNNFFDLEKAPIKQLNSDFDGFPSAYVRIDGRIHLLPKPSSNGTMKVHYVRRLDNLDVREAVISDVTTSGNSITSLTLDPSGSVFNRTILLQYSRVSVVGYEGEQKMRNIPITDIDNTTGVVTLVPGFEFEDGESIAIGDYLVKDFDTANKSELPEICERYLISYMNWKIFKSDSSSDSREAEAEVMALEKEILDSFAETDADITHIPIISDQFIDEDF